MNSRILDDIAFEFGREFAEKEFEKRKNASVKSQLVRNLKTWLLMFLFMTICIAPSLVIYGVLSEDNTSGYWCIPLMLLNIALGAITAIVLLPKHEFTLLNRPSDLEVLQTMRLDFKNEYFVKRQNVWKLLLICLGLGLFYGLVMLLGVVAWNGWLIPYIGKICNSVICLLSLGLPALAYFGIMSYK